MSKFLLGRQFLNCITSALVYDSDDLPVGALDVPQVFWTTDGHGLAIAGVLNKTQDWLAGYFRSDNTLDVARLVAELGSLPHRCGLILVTQDEVHIAASSPTGGFRCFHTVMTGADAYVVTFNTDATGCTFGHIAIDPASAVRQGQWVMSYVTSSCGTKKFVRALGSTALIVTPLRRDGWREDKGRE